MTTIILKKYLKRLTLITVNNKDFPLIVHDRIGTTVLDLDNKGLTTLGFYKFNINKWDNEVKQLLESEDWST